MQPILTILIPTLTIREFTCKDLVNELSRQIAAGDFPVKITLYPNDGSKGSIGVIRNRMMKRVKTKYLVFFDDDDKPSPNYISSICEALNLYPDVDAVGFIVDVFVSGSKDGCARISHEYPDWDTPKVMSAYKYLRTINHIAVVKSDLARAAGFPKSGEKAVHGEDYEYSKNLKPLIKSSHTINEILYNYYFEPKKPALAAIAFK